MFVASGAYAQCSKDTDCKGDRVCNKGECMEPVSASPAPAATQPPAAPAPTEASPPATTPPVAEPQPAQAPPSAAPAPVAVAAPSPQSDPLAPDADYLPNYRRFSTPLMATGIGVTAGAPLVLVLGAVLSKSAYNSCVSDIAADRNHASAPEVALAQDCNDAHMNRLYVLAGVAVVMVGAGIPMIIVGNHKVPANPQPQALLLPYAGPQRAGLTLHVTF